MIYRLSIVHRQLEDRQVVGEQRAVHFFARSDDAFRTWQLLHDFGKPELDVRLERESSTGGWSPVDPLGR
jgi:hypothetical protein